MFSFGVGLVWSGFSTKVSSSSGWSLTYYVVKDDLISSALSKCWDYRCGVPLLIYAGLKVKPRTWCLLRKHLQLSYIPSFRFLGHGNDEKWTKGVPFPLLPGGRPSQYIYVHIYVYILLLEVFLIFRVEWVKKECVCIQICTLAYIWSSYLCKERCMFNVPPVSGKYRNIDR